MPKWIDQTLGNFWSFEKMKVVNWNSVDQIDRPSTVITRGALQFNEALEDATCTARNPSLKDQTTLLQVFWEGSKFQTVEERLLTVAQPVTLGIEQKREIV